MGCRKGGHARFGRRSASKQLRLTAGSRCHTAQLLGLRSRRLDPAQCAPPLEHRRRARQGQHGCRVRQTQAPQTVVVGAGKQGAALLTHRLPEPLRLRCIDRLASQGLAGGGHGCLRTAQPQIELSAGVRRREPAAGVDRQGLARPAIELLQGLALRHVEAQGGLGHRTRQYLERDFGDQAQRTERARHQARDIVAGHVLHDLATEAQQLGLPVEHLHAQHMVARCPRGEPRRAGQAGRDHAAHRRAGTEMGRLEGQVLAVLGQQRLQFSQRGAGQRRHHQFTGLVAADAAQRPGIEDLPLQLLAVEVLAAAPADAQHRAIGQRGSDLVGKRGQQRVHLPDGNDTRSRRREAFERGAFKNLNLSRETD